MEGRVLQVSGGGGVVEMGGGGAYPACMSGGFRGSGGRNDWTIVSFRQVQGTEIELTRGARRSSKPRNICVTS